MTKGQAKLWIGIAIGALIAIFALQNNEPVSIVFLFWQVTMPRSLLIACLFGVGLLSGWLIGALKRRPS